ncbi:MAG: DUF393 domain-containing protein [Pseudomonadota bacterium]
MSMSREATRVYYDGGCPVCRREIGWYMRWRGAERIDWVDLAADKDLSDADRCALMQRFTVEREDGQRADGAAGFVALWRALPATRRLGRLLDNIVAVWVLERAYRGFLAGRRLWRRAP